MARVGNLRVFLDRAETNELGPKSTRYRIIEASVDLALRLLETQRGMSSLEYVAGAIIDARTAEARQNKLSQPILTYRKPKKELPYWIGHFLRKLRATFPPIYLEDIGRKGATTRRYEWGNDLNEYDPVEACTVTLNSTLVENATLAREMHRTSPDAYHTSKFQLGLIIAHEIVHIFSGFLLHPDRPGTPEPVCIPPYAQEDLGEAGHFWEAQFFNGCIEFWAVKNHPLHRRQPGIPYIFESTNSACRGWEIPQEEVKRFIDGDFPSFDFRNKPSEVREDLKGRKMILTGNLRHGKSARRLPHVDSPPPDHSSTSVAYYEPYDGETPPSRRPITSSGGLSYGTRGSNDRFLYDSSVPSSSSSSRYGEPSSGPSYSSRQPSSGHSYGSREPSSGHSYSSREPSSGHSYSSRQPSSGYSYGSRELSSGHSYSSREHHSSSYSYGQPAAGSGYSYGVDGYSNSRYVR